MADSTRTRGERAHTGARLHDVFAWSAVVAAVLGLLLAVVFDSYYEEILRHRGEHVVYDVEVAREMVEPTLERLHAGVITREQAIDRARRDLATLSIRRGNEHRVIWLVDASGELLDQLPESHEEAAQRV
ncbi:MAG: hypothetical protein AAGI01_17680, partial [Myxococcota bacterium]